VLEPGQFACGAGTSGVILAVTDKPVSDRSSRINTFLHVNHNPHRRRYAVVLCINGMGIAYSWLLQLLRRQSSTSVSYEELNELASSAPLGSDGLRFLPFGNGAERLLNNQAPGASLLNADFNRHDLPHVSRAVIEGVVMAIAHGNTVLDELAISPSVLRAGEAGLFKCKLFSQLLSTALDCPIELRDSDPSQGAATGALVSGGYADSVEELIGSQLPKALIEPMEKEKDAVRDLYESWSAHLPSERP
jgi:xylulokinase